MNIMKWTNDNRKLTNYYIPVISPEHRHVSILILNISLLMLTFTSKTVQLACRLIVLINLS